MVVVVGGGKFSPPSPTWGGEKQNPLVPPQAEPTSAPGAPWGEPGVGHHDGTHQGPPLPHVRSLGLIGGHQQGPDHLHGPAFGSFHPQVLLQRPLGGTP